MPRISEFYGIAVYMYFSDHPPPRFPAIYSGHEVIIAIHSLEVLGGALSRRASRLVRAWARAHRAELPANWNRARDGLPLLPIEPLP